MFDRESDSRPGADKRDWTTDFDQAEDIIDLGRIDAVAFSGGNQSFTFIGSTNFSATAGELRYFVSGGPTMTVVQGDTSGNGIADFEIRVTGVFGDDLIDWC